MADPAPAASTDVPETVGDTALRYRNAAVYSGAR